MWAQVVDGQLAVAPGALPPDVTDTAAPGLGWLPVVDLNTHPGAGFDVDEALTIRADRVDRRWTNPRPTAVAANRQTIDELLGTALTNLRAYAAPGASPNAAQTTAAVKLLCRVVAGLVRLERADFTETP